MSDQRCEHLPRPVAVTEPCNTDCEVRWGLLHKHTQLYQQNPLQQRAHISTLFSNRWHVAGRSECSAKCGPGHHSLDVQCMKYNLMKRQSERAETGACSAIAKPPTRQPCHGDCLLKSWQYSAWSQVLSTQREPDRMLYKKKKTCFRALSKTYSCSKCSRFKQCICKFHCAYSLNT